MGAGDLRRLFFNMEILRGPCGLTIELDADQIVPGDPGQGTPAMVVLWCGRQRIASGTFACVASTGEFSDFMHGRQGQAALNRQHLEWLCDKEDEVDAWLEAEVKKLADKDGSERVG